MTQNSTTTESYDPVGNRLSSLGVSPYNHNASNELTSTPNTTYDNNGNTQSKTDSTGTTNYTGDFENRLASVMLPGSGGSVTFKYDPFGRRICKSSSSDTSIHAFDGDNLVEETNAAGAVVARYAQTQSIDEPVPRQNFGSTELHSLTMIQASQAVGFKVGHHFGEGQLVGCRVTLKCSKRPRSWPTTKKQ